MQEILPSGISLAQVDIWFQDESRIGQQGSQTRMWAKRGTRPRVVKQQQFLYQYIYGAVCPSQKTCAALVLPYANQHGMQEHLEEISSHVPQGRHGVVVMDQAGWPSNKKPVHPEKSFDPASSSLFSRAQPSRASLVLFERPLFGESCF